VPPFSWRDLSIPAFLLLAAAVPDQERSWPSVSVARVQAIAASNHLKQ